MPRNGSQFLYLSNKVGFLVIELFVLCPIRVELHQELHELVLIPQKYIENWFRFVWVGDKHLMKEVDIFKNWNFSHTQMHKNFTRDDNYFEFLKLNDVEEQIVQFYTLKTWKASNCIFLERSFNIFIMSFRLSGLEMYLVIT